MSVKVLVVEDEPAIADFVNFLLAKMGYQVLDVVDNYTDALTSVQVNDPDIVVIDISIRGDSDGVSLGKAIRESFDRPLIFVTSHTDQETVQRAKEVKPNGYLTKPFKEHDLSIAIEMALNNYVGTSETKEVSDEVILRDAIFIRSNKNFIKLMFSEVEWLKADGNYTEIYTLNQKHVVRNTLNEVEKRLPANEFLRVHRSFTVRIRSITAINSQSVILKSTEVPLSKKMHAWLLSNLNLLSS